jgi:hypothetical protein
LNASRLVIENRAVATVDSGESEYEPGHAGLVNWRVEKAGKPTRGIRPQAIGVCNYLKPDA